VTRNYIDLVGKTLRVMEVLDDARGSLPIAELAKRTGLVKSSLFRILYSLKEHGYVEQKHEGGEYFLAVKAAVLGRSVLDMRSLRAIAAPHMQRLSRRLEETVALAHLENGQPIMAEIVESTRPVRVVLSMAAVCYFHASSLGKAMAAFLPRAEVERVLYLQGMPRLTENTIRTKKQLFAELEHVKRKGYAVNREESHHGAIYLAAPIFDRAGEVTAGMNVGLPASRHTEEREIEIASLLKKSCQRISEELGCPSLTACGLLSLPAGPARATEASGSR